MAPGSLRSLVLPFGAWPCMNLRFVSLYLRFLQRLKYGLSTLPATDGLGGGSRKPNKQSAEPGGTTNTTRHQHLQSHAGHHSISSRKPGPTFRSSRKVGPARSYHQQFQSTKRVCLYLHCRATRHSHHAVFRDFSRGHLSLHPTSQIQWMTRWATWSDDFDDFTPCAGENPGVSHRASRPGHPPQVCD